MRKKYLSALLFGALLFASAGTFTSCKDYDDEIENLQGQINKVVTDLESLKTTVEGLGGVTDVKIEGGKLVVVSGDNTVTYDLPAAGGDVEKTKVELDGQDLKVDDVVIGKVGDKVTVNEDGFLCVNGTPTEIKAGKYAVLDNDADGVVTITLPDANGELKTVELAKASSAFTEIEILGYCTEGKLTSVDNKNIKYNYFYIDDAKFNALSNWNKEEGTRKVVKGQVLSTLSASNSSLMIRLAPATFDASKLSFTLVNSLLQEAPVTLGTPEAYEKLLTRADIKNGIWTLPTVADIEQTYKSGEEYEESFKKGSDKIAFALKEDGGFATNYDLTFERDGSMSMNAKVEKVNGENIAVEDRKKPWDNLQSLTDDKINKVDAGKVEITFDNAIYDAHLDIDEATIQRWGITDVDGTSFNVGKRPDDITSANFQVKVHYVTLKGEEKSEWLAFTVAKSFAGQTELQNTDHMINADKNKDKFSVSLNDMYTDLGDKAALWKADVKKIDIKLFQVGTGADGKDKEVTLPASCSFTVADKDGKLATSTATQIIADFKQNWPSTDDDYALDKDYYLLVSFTDGKDVLNTVKVPFTMNIPELSTFLVKQKGVFNGTNDGTAYVFSTKYVNTNKKDVVALQYDLNYAFVGLDKLGDTTIKFSTNGYIGGDKNNSKGPIVGLLDNNKTTYVDSDMTADGTAHKVALVAKEGKNADVYGQQFKIEVSEAKYIGKYVYGEEERKSQAFTVKMLSPIAEGSITAADGSDAISIDATDNQKIVESKFKAVTYSTAETAYKLFPSEETKKGSSIYNWIKYSGDKNTITITPKDDKVLKVTEIANTVDGKDGYEGYVKVEPINPAYDTEGVITVTVNDVWGFKVSKDITVNIKK